MEANHPRMLREWLDDLQRFDLFRFGNELVVLQAALANERGFGEPSAGHVAAQYRNPPVARIAADDLDGRAFGKIGWKIVEHELADLHAGVGLVRLAFEHAHAHLPLIRAAGVVDAAALGGDGPLL